MASAATVSRVLGQQFDRSKSQASRVRGYSTSSAGFQVKASPTDAGTVLVEYIPGAFAHHLDAETRKERADRMLSAYAEVLGKRWTVRRHPSYRNVLVVTDKEVVQPVEVAAPAPEGFAQGQAVIVQHPGRSPFTGTVAHIHTAPGYVAVRDDRRNVVNHPTRFVSAAETEEEPEEFERCEPVMGGKVHTLMPGAPEGHAFPQCRTGGSANRGTRYRVVTAPLTCSTCLAYEERRAAHARR
ncbi:hypothetical protein [Streptomyces sp. DH12]|uniref:hypothetical protein n=1 Tax=Streptomyces sp. DH12 TaxID=2857010 RepID=UPI001E43927D|nr:hypothetical protein [Streptomyces sp. DH12]